MKNTKHVFFYAIALMMAFALTACDSKKETDPLTAIKNLAEEISKESDEWDETQWTDATGKIAEAYIKLPSPLETQEKMTLESALSLIKLHASHHERKAAKMLEWLGKLDNNEEKEELQDQSVFLKGSIGQFPVTMHLDISDGQVSGSYHYDKGSTELQLSGTADEEGNLDINETTQEGRPTGHFAGKLNDGRFTGEFINYKGEHFPFHLSTDGSPAPADMETTGGSAPRDGSLRASDIILPSSLRGNVEVVDGNMPVEIDQYGYPEISITFRLLKTMNTASLASEYGQLWIVGVGQDASGRDVRELLPNYNEWRTDDSDGKDFKEFLEDSPGSTITMTFSGGKDGDVNSGVAKVSKFKLKITN